MLGKRQKATADPGGFFLFGPVRGTQRDSAVLHLAGVGSIPAAPEGRVFALLFPVVSWEQCPPG